MIVRATRSPAAAARGGFTLLEVLVVVAILVILASLATFATVRYLEQTKMNQAKLQMQKIEQAAKAFQLEKGYTPQVAELVNATQDANGNMVAPNLEGGQSAITDPWGQPYQVMDGQDPYGSTRILVICTSKNLQWPEPGK